MSVKNPYARTAGLGVICMMICLLLVPLSGCGEPTPPPEPVTITFIHWAGDADRIEAFVQEFHEEYPHITVDLHSADMGQLAWNFGAEDADVREVYVAIIDSQRQRGDFLPVDPFIEADESVDVYDFYPAALEAFTIDGKTWAIPYGLGCDVMYYNKDLFDQYGVAYPESEWTWDDFVSTAAAIRDPDAGVYGYTNLGDWGTAWLFVHQHGGRIVDDMQNPSRATFDDPLTVEALEWYGSLYHEYDVAFAPQGTFGERVVARAGAVLKGEVGMWSCSFALQGGGDGEIWWTEWPMRWGMVTYPRSTGRSATDIAGNLFARGYAISSQTQHPDAAWQLVASLSRQMPGRLIPARRSLVEPGEYDRQVGSEAAAIVRAALENGLPYPPRDFIDTTLKALVVLSDADYKIETGAMTPQEAMDWAQQQAERRIGP
jgi:ABC-type glycerol-3-phosphate transport system substrate-binding protein